MHVQRLSLRQFTPIWLLVILTFSLPPTLAQADDLLAISTSVELKESNYQGISQLHGELNLGDISAGSKIIATFDIINKSANSIELHGIKPSCSCVDLKIASGVLMPDSKLARLAEANLTVPQAIVNLPFARRHQELAGNGPGVGGKVRTKNGATPIDCGSTITCTLGCVQIVVNGVSVRSCGSNPLSNNMPMLPRFADGANCQAFPNPLVVISPPPVVAVP